MSTPYREGEAKPRYVCIVCYKTASTTEGTCPRCGGAPLQSVDSDEVMTALRERAKEKKKRPEKMQWLTVFIGAAIFDVVLYGVLLGSHAIEFKSTHDARPLSRWGSDGIFLYPFVMWIGFIIVFTYLIKWTGIFRGSIEAAAKFNPDTADVAELLAWLDVRVDAKTQPTEPKLN